MRHRVSRAGTSSPRGEFQAQVSPLPGNSAACLESNAVDRPAVPLLLLQAGPCGHIPEPPRRVKAGGAHVSAQRVERHAAQAVGVARQGRETAGPPGPQLGAGVRGPGHKCHDALVCESRGCVGGKGFAVRGPKAREPAVHAGHAGNPGQVPPPPPLAKPGAVGQLPVLPSSLSRAHGCSPVSTGCWGFQATPVTRSVCARMVSVGRQVVASQTLSTPLQDPSNSWEPSGEKEQPATGRSSASSDTWFPSWHSRASSSAGDDGRGEERGRRAQGEGRKGGRGGGP